MRSHIPHIDELQGAGIHFDWIKARVNLIIKNITNTRTWIIAEIGINHEGSVERCLELVNSAALAGADAVKLQTITPELNYAKDTESYKLFSKATISLKDTAKVFDYIRVAYNIEVATKEVCFSENGREYYDLSRSAIARSKR